jgi:hypothetical protein
MLTTQTRELLERLRTGNLAASDASDLEHMAAGSLIQDLQLIYPIVFQERTLKQKREIGLARMVRYELSLSRNVESLFTSVRLHAVIHRCILISSYDDAVSEITTTRSIRLLPVFQPVKSAIVKMDRGFKLDKTPDGWTVKRLGRKSTKLSEEFLRARGWRFDVLSPVGGQQ